MPGVDNRVRRSAKERPFLPVSEESVSPRRRTSENLRRKLGHKQRVTVICISVVILLYLYRNWTTEHEFIGDRSKRTEEVQTGIFETNAPEIGVLREELEKVETPGPKETDASSPVADIESVDDGRGGTVDDRQEDEESSDTSEGDILALTPVPDVKDNPIAVAERTMAPGLGFKYFSLDHQGHQAPQAEAQGEVQDVKGVVPDIPSVPRSDEDLHIIFSTECSDYQNWQSLLFFYGAARVGNMGRITRLASGCTDDQIAALREVHKALPPQHTVHFTPDFALDPTTGDRYPYYNKPNALRHFLTNMSPPITEAVIALLDPDMILLRRLTTRLEVDGNEMFSIGDSPPNVRVRGTEPWITEGHPAGQHFTLGNSWATWSDLPSIVGPNSPALNVGVKDANLFYPVGPPYLAHPRDWIKLAEKWVEFVPQAFKGHPGILSEMYAFIIAAAHLKLPHTVLRSWMISNAQTSRNEGWDYFDNLHDDELCTAADPPRKWLPLTLHFCQMYRMGTYMFGKRHATLKGIFACDKPYLLEPPLDIHAKRVKVHRKKEEWIGREVARRQTFALCTTTRLLNQALRDYRHAVCPEEQFTKGLTHVKQLTDLLPSQLKVQEVKKEIKS